jgi:hypothetical protein
MLKFFGFLWTVTCVVLLLLPFKDGSSVSEAAMNEVIQQVPYSLDIISARHPLKVGLIRSLLNTNGQLDSSIESYLRANEHPEKMNIFESYFMYYFVMLDKDGMRKTMADDLEKRFSLN